MKNFVPGDRVQYRGPQGELVVGELIEFAPDGRAVVRVEIEAYEDRHVNAGELRPAS